MASRKSHGVSPSQVLRTAVDALVRVHGVRGASVMLGISRESIVRVVAGVPVRAGTIALVEKQLAELDPKTEPTGGQS